MAGEFVGQNFDFIITICDNAKKDEQGQTDFFIQYIDHESHTVKRYYPDFPVRLEDESWLIVEVKGDNLIEASIVQAKAQYAQQFASART